MEISPYPNSIKLFSVRDLTASPNETRDVPRDEAKSLCLRRTQAELVLLDAVKERMSLAIFWSNGKRRIASKSSSKICDLMSVAESSADNKLGRSLHNAKK